MMKRGFCMWTLGLWMLAGIVSAETFVVATNGSGDYSSIQAAMDAAGAGDIVEVNEGIYYERLYLSNRGAAGAGYVILRSADGARVLLSGGGVHSSTDPHMIEIDADAAYLCIQGLEICSNLTDDVAEEDGGSGIYMEGRAHHITISSNRIYEMRGMHGMGITLYGSDASRAVSNLLVAGNEIFDCDPATSEALTLNGNIVDFQVSSNYVHDVDNIGIDFIGGEWLPNAARRGRCSFNRVERANSSYGDGYAAGIYVDGGRDIIIERNWVEGCDMGIEVGAENAGWLASNVVVRNNVLYKNNKAGIMFGGYDAGRGRVIDSCFENNTLYQNARWTNWMAEIVIQWSSNCTVRNNLVWVSTNRDTYAVYDSTAQAASQVQLDYNLYYHDASPSGLLFGWQGSDYTGFTNYQNAATPNETNSVCEDPLLMNPASTNLHVTQYSWAVDRLPPETWPSGDVLDRDGHFRVLNNRRDIGAYEYPFSNSIPRFGAWELLSSVPYATRWTNLVLGGDYAVDWSTSGVVWAACANEYPISQTVMSANTDASNSAVRFFRCRRVLP